MIQFILIIIQLVLFVASTLLTKPPKTENARPRSLGDFQFPTATEARAVPILWGTMDIKGPNVIWAGDLKTLKLQKKISGGFFSGSKKVTVGYRYFIGMDLLLCYGPIDRITRLEISDKVAFSGSVNMASSGDTGTSLVISKPTLLGGKEKGGGVVGTFRLYKGSSTQQRDSYMISKAGGGDPDNIPGYVDIAHAVFRQGEVGETAQIGNYVFRASRFPNNLGLGSNRHIIAGTLDSGDANPAEVLWEVMTDTRWGLQFDTSRLDIADFQAAGITLFNEGLGISQLITSVGQALEVIQDVLRLVDGVFYETTAGKFRFKLIRNDYTVGTLPVFDETNVIGVDNFSRMSWSQTINHLHAGYTDRTKDFVETGSMAQDLANYRTQDQEARADQTYPGLAHPDAAAAVVERELRQLSYPFAKVKLIVNRDGQSLRPGDVIRWSNLQLGIELMVLRVLTVELGDMGGGQIVLNAVQDVFGLSEEIYAPSTDTAWTPVSNTAVAFTTELVRSVPRLFLNLSFYTDGSADPALGERIHSMAVAPTGAVSTFEQWVDRADGAGYVEGFGSATSCTPSATLVGAYSAATADIEASNLLVVQSGVDLEQLTDLTDADLVKSGFNLALIQGATEGADEIIGWETLFDNGDGTFQVRNVHRGLMDTQARSHSAGARIYFFSDGQAISDVPFADTVAITVKHQSETTEDELAIASATARALTFASRLKRPHHPARIRLAATTRLPVLVTGTADLVFDWLHRLNVDPQILDAGVGSTGSQHSEVEYDLEFRHLWTQAVLRNVTRTTADGAGWLTYTYTAANLQSDTGQVGRFPLEARFRARYAAGATANPANLTSLQQVLGSFSADIGGSVLRSVDLNGTNEYLANTTAATIGITNAWTIEAWVRPRASAGGATAHIMTLQPAAGNINRIELFLSDTSAAAKFSVLVYNSAGALIKDYDFGSYAVNTWTLLTVTWSGTALRVFQDGVEDAAPTKNTDGAGSQTATNRQVRLGADGTGAASFLDALLYRCSIWNSVRTPASITAGFTAKSTFDSRFNTGAYVEASALQQLWDWRDSASVGESYGNNATLINVSTNAVNVDATDLDTGVPT